MTKRPDFVMALLAITSKDAGLLGGPHMNFMKFLIHTAQEPVLRRSTVPVAAS
jgi:hypothetical protein